MKFEPTEENILTFIKEGYPAGVDQDDQAGIDAFYECFNQVVSERENEYYCYVVEHVESGKFFEVILNYDSWAGVDYDYPVSGPDEVVEREVTVKKWIKV